MINFLMARILVVEDEALVCRTIERALVKVGHEVVSARTKEELTRTLTSGTFDLLVLDLHMPDMEAGEVLSMVRDKNPGVRVLVVSGSPDVEGLEVLEKPFQIETLRQKVRQLLGGQ